MSSQSLAKLKRQSDGLAKQLGRQRAAHHPQISEDESDDDDDDCDLDDSMDAGAKDKLEVHEEEGLANSQLKLGGGNETKAQALGERASLKLGGSRPVLQTAARRV